MTAYDRFRAAAHRLSVTMQPRHDWTLIFIHIPKTAGTSLRQAIGSAYEPEQRLFLYDAPHLERSMHPRDFPGLPESERAELRFIMGHIPFGLHTDVPRESRYVAVLRDPVDRVISHYYHYRQVVDPDKGTRPAEERQLIEKQDISLEDWVFDLRRAEADNQLVRYISGHTMIPYGTCTDDMLREAIDHIDEHFETVMFAEDMIESTRALGSRLGFVIPTEVRANVNSKRPGVSDLDLQVLERIRELNRLDIELYETMRERQRAAMPSRRVRWLTRDRSAS